MSVKLEIDLAFGEEEYLLRQQVAREAMRERGLDALLLFSQHSQYYLFGYQIIHAAILYQVIILPVDGPPTAIIRSLDEPILRSAAYEGDIIVWGLANDDPIDGTIDALKKMGLGAGARLGMETRHHALSLNYYDRLQKSVLREGLALVEASDILISQRARKSPAEVGLLRRAAKLLDVTYEAAFAAMREGALESQVNAQALHAAYMAGADENVLPLLISSGVNTITCTHLPATHKPLRRGEPILMEAGASVASYYAVAAHSVVCARKADSEMERKYRDVRRVACAGIDAMGPGVAHGEVGRAMRSAAPEGGHIRDFLDKYYFAYGTGIGFASIWYDEIYGLASKGSFQPGNVVSVFSLDKKDGEYLLCTVDPVLITDTGCERLSEIDYEEFRVVGI